MVQSKSRIQQLDDDFRRLGLNPFRVPLGIMLNEQNYRVSTCIRCNTCDGHPCLVNAKSDAQVVCVDPAIQYPNVALLTNTHAERLEACEAGGQVTTLV